MRVLLPLALASFTLAGCVYGPPPTGTTQTRPPVTTVTPPTDPVTPAMRSAASQVVNREMAKRLPGVNVAPYTNCVIQNAEVPELVRLASMSAGDTAGAAGAVAGIVQRPATTQCISAVARTA